MCSTDIFFHTSVCKYNTVASFIFESTVTLVRLNSFSRRGPDTSYLEGNLNAGCKNVRDSCHFVFSTILNGVPEQYIALDKRFEALANL